MIHGLLRIWARVASIKYVRKDGEGSAGPKSDVVREVARILNYILSSPKCIEGDG